MSFAGLLATLLIIALGIVLLVGLIWLGVTVLATLFKVIGQVISHVFSFIFGVIGDAARVIGAVILLPIFTLFIVGSVLFGRWSAASHYGRAFNSEVSTIFLSCYRILVGRPLRLIGLGQTADAFEHRLPQVMAETPGKDRPSKKRVGMFDGYTILGSLQSGGSGSRLYIAEPDEVKRAGFERRGIEDIDRVVIKVFSLKDGSSLPQILRESRSLDAAKKLGLVLEHAEDDGRFFYVMRYVPGDSLATITQRLHAASGESGLDKSGLDSAVGYISDLLETLHTYHSGGLWHKDVKPDNIIVAGSRAHLVDFGLVTPLRSAMTLTTHGTEYFRDPELVRQALRGVKVHQIDGARFDVYAAGAVLYSVIENSFPAHGGLSQITKRCPEALRWIVRRAMTDYDQRYPTAASMLADLEALRAAPDPFKVRPADLPSMKDSVGAPDLEPTPEPEPMSPEEVVRRAATPIPPKPPAPDAPRPAGRARPQLTLTDWWTGRYSVDRPGAPVPPARRTPRRPVTPAGARARAHEQVVSARARAAETRKRAHDRIHNRRQAIHANPRRHDRSGALGIAVALILFGALGIAAVVALMGGPNPARSRYVVNSPTPGVVVIEPAPAIPAPAGEIHPASMSLEGSMLVVSDLGLPLHPDLMAKIGEGVVALRASGLELSGDFVTDPVLLDEDEYDRQVELLAQARHARGVLPLDSKDFAERVRPFFEDHPELDLLLWLEPNKHDETLFDYLLIAPGSVSKRGIGADQPIDHIVESVELATD